MHADMRAVAWRAVAAPVLFMAISAAAAGQGQCELAEFIGDRPDDGFGYAVDASGRRVVIRAKFSGGPGGAARVYERCGASWSCVAELVADDHAPGTGFANSLAIDGDRVVVGARGDDVHGTNSGSAYVFEDAHGEWSQVAKLLADDGNAYDNFGCSVAISGERVVVGALWDGPGSAYVFERQADGTWPQVQKLTASDAQGGDHFGDAVGIKGDVIVIGAQDDDDLGWNSGSAYVFEQGTPGEWSEVAKVLPHDGQFLDGFGSSVSVHRNRVLIGSPGADGQVQSSGAAYVFERTGDATWLEVGKLFASDGANSDIFGCAVALKADVGVIGARGDDDHGQCSGSAYVFVRADDGAWSEVGKLVPDDGAPWDSFGRAVAVSGNIGVIGTYPQDPNEPPKPGMAYIYAVGPDEDGDGVMDACECPGDLNKDWIVDFLDVLVLLEDWGCTGGECPGDCDLDGDTDHGDLGLLLANWGNICP